jgi:mono/diheme cytochrome c family protein
VTQRTQLLCIAASLAFVAWTGCRRDMQDQPKVIPLRPSQFFADGRSARPIPPNTIARDELNDTDSFHTGADKNGFLNQIPMKVDRAMLQRGEQRYNIYCTPCHGMLGDGNGMVTRRGFKWPSNLHTDRIRNAPPGYLFQVISNGYGAMPHYDDQIPVQDRWNIVAYVRALQLSRHASINDVAANERAQLEKR